jgi:Lipase (class 3)
MTNRLKKYDATKRALFFPQEMPSIFEANTKYTDAVLSAEAARLAYIRFEKEDAEKERIKQSLDVVGYSDVKFENNEGTQVFAALNATTRTAIIAFRGTQIDSMSDIYTDLHVSLCGWQQGGKVHNGFSRAYLRIHEWVDQWIKNNNPQRIIVTGHSLGGALATLMASIYVQAELYTIGSPRVGNHDFAELFKNRIVHRYVNCVDVVTAVAPELLGYQHVAPEIYIDRFGEIHTDQAKTARDEDTHRARIDYLTTQSWRLGTIELRDLADHAPVNYIYALLS